jgi:NDP-sugar pyrophosphorylase family protein
MEANGGIYLLKKELLHLIPRNQPYKAWELINKLLAERQHTLSVFLISDIWIDIGSKESFIYAEQIAQNTSSLTH